MTQMLVTKNTEQEEEIEEPHVSRHRKIHTNSWLVHSIDSALDPDNYDEITYSNKDGSKSNKSRTKIS